MKIKQKKRKNEEDYEDEPKLYPAEEQGIIPEETLEEKQLKMGFGEEDEDLEIKEGREEQVEEDEIEPWEAGFAEGASDEGQLAKDALTGEPLMGIDDVVELEIEGKKYRFINEENAEKFKEKKEEESLD